MKKFNLLLAVVAVVTTIGSRASAASSVSFDLPTAGSTFNLMNVTKLYFQGNCDVAGETVKVSVAKQAAMNATCNTSKIWSLANVSIAAAPDGPVAVEVVKTSDPSVVIRRTYIKDTFAPVLVVNAPKSGDSILATNVSAFAVNGICSESGQPLQITLKRAVDDQNFPAITTTLVCPSSRAWNTTFDLRSLGDNTDIQLIATHTDSSGNQNIQSSSYYMDIQLIKTGFTNLPSSINTTNAASFVVNGYCNKNSSSISLIAKITGTSYLQDLTTNCIDGKWQFNTLSFAGAGVPDGTIELTIVLLNPLTGQRGETSVTLTKDTVPPVLTIASPSSGFRMSKQTGTTLTVSGKCSENGRAITIAGAAKASAVCSSGAYSASLDLSAVADGDQSFTVTSLDAVGNSTTQSLSINKDVMPALLTMNSLVSINAANATTLSLTGTCSEFGAYAQPVKISGAITGTAICQQGGTWTLNLSSFSVSDGNLTFIANHADASGNAAPAVTMTVTKDTVPPTLKLTSPVLPQTGKFMVSLQNIGSVVFAGSCSKNGATIRASGKLSGSATCTNGAWSISGAALGAVSDGDLSISFRITDSVGNASQQDIIIFKDTTAPTISVAGSPFKINVTSAENVAIRGSCSEFGSFAQPVLISGIDSSPLSAVCASGSWVLSVAKTKFPEGSSSFSVSHKDLVGNASTASGTVIKDSTPPTVTISSTAAFVNLSNVSAVSFKGTCSETGINVLLSGAVSSSAASENGVWTKTIDMSSVPDGNLTISLSQTDASGNRATQDLVRVKDTVAPTVTIVSPAEGQDVYTTGSLSITGACSELGAQVNIAGSFTGSVLCQSGSWVLNVSGGPSEATISASIIDAVGNASTAERAFKNSKANVKPLANNRLSIGYSHGCVIQSGALKCWGFNSQMQISESAPKSFIQPTTVFSSGVVSVSAFANQTCAIVDGAVKCWGADQLGSVGAGKTFPIGVSSGVVTAVGSNATSVSGSCAVVNGGMTCWGGANPNIEDLEGFTGTFNQRKPRPAFATRIAASVEAIAGPSNACAIVAGAVKCWGGYVGTVTGSTSPYTVISAGAQAIASSSSGTTHCAVVAGSLQCWGEMYGGNFAPKTVISAGVQAVAMGTRHICAIVFGDLQCWGENRYGALGNGSLVATKFGDPPVTVIAGGVTDVAASGYQTCAIAKGELSCWGQPSPVLAKTFAQALSPQLVVSSGVKDAFVSEYYTLVSLAGSVEGWGALTAGSYALKAGPIEEPAQRQILDSSASLLSSDFYTLIDGRVMRPSQDIWNPIANPPPGRISGISRGTLTVGYFTSILMVSDGALYAWNANYGAGSPLISANVVEADANRETACARVSDSLWCWGANSYGELGNGSTSYTKTTTPALVIPSGVSSFALGYYHLCAVVSGSLKCWGRNHTGQLGDGSTTDSLLPKTVISSGVTSVSALGSTTCAIVNGVTKCWGYGGYGQLGNGSTASSLVPVSIDTGLTKLYSWAGALHFCGSDPTGALKCWGSNDQGQSNWKARVAELKPAGNVILTGL